MRTTSPGYDPFPSVRSPGAHVAFEVLPKALAKSSIAAEGSPAAAGSVSNLLNGAAELQKKYATLEQNGWPLDGSCSVLADSGTEAGYWSAAVSDGDGIFSSPPVIRMELPAPTSTFGWTFHFDAPGGIFPPEIGIVCYDARGEELARLTAEPDGPGTKGRGFSVNRFVGDYSAVEFTFFRTNEPLRMLRLAEIDFGVSRHFDRDSIGEMRIRYGLSPDASAFPAKEFVFTFDNSDGEFNVLDPVGAYQYWRNGQILTARIVVGDESVDMGQFYVTKAEIGKNRLTAKVTAHDECYRLAGQKFYPGSLAAAETVSLAEAVSAVTAGYEMPVDLGGLGAERVSLAIGSGHAKRTVLRYLAQAARASVWIDRDGVLRFRRLAAALSPDGRITADELYGWNGVSISEEITGVTLTVPRELEPDEDGNPTKELYAAGQSDDRGAHTAVYENPCVAAANGQAVADWLLVMSNWRKQYAVKNRCDPAVEIGDTLEIADAFGNDGLALVTGIEISYDGVLSAVTEAAGEF